MARAKTSSKPSSKSPVAALELPPFGYFDGTDEARALGAVAAEFFAPVLPQPFAVEDLCIFAEDGAGLFHLIGRHPLTGG